MLYRNPLHLFLLTLCFAAAVIAQQGPVTKSEIFSALENAKSSDELLQQTNEKLIEEIEERGLDFLLTPEEEWQLEMRDASEELIGVIRGAIDPAERAFRLKVRKQQRLYLSFATNFNSRDLEGRQAALDAAREFISLYENDPHVAEIVTFMQRNVPRMQRTVSMMERRQEAVERARAQALERQQRQQEQRAERDRRRQEAAASAAAAKSNAQTQQQKAPVAPTPVTKEPQDDQPTERRRPVFPVVRRP